LCKIRFNIILSPRPKWSLFTKHFLSISHIPHACYYLIDRVLVLFSSNYEIPCSVLFTISPRYPPSTSKHLWALCSQTQSYFVGRKSELEVRNLCYSYCINHKLKCWCNTFTKNATENCTIIVVNAQKGGAHQDSVVDVVIRYNLEGLGIDSLWGEIFRNWPNRLWAHPAFCTAGSGLFSVLKRPGLGVNHPPSSSTEVKERIKLPLYLRGGLYGETYLDFLPLPFSVFLNTQIICCLPSC
jgi:hypothetical protein